MAPANYLRQNTQLLHANRIQNHEFDSQQMDNFSERLSYVEEKQDELHKSDHDVKESVEKLIDLLNKHFSK